MNWWKALRGERVGKATLGLGAACFMAGLALLAFGVYSAFQGESNAQDQPLAVAQATTPGAPASPTLSSAPGASKLTPVPAPPLGDTPYRLTFERLGVDAPVQSYGLDKSQVPVVPTGSDAAEVVAWYDFSARPGTGNAVFAGHVTWYGRAVFYDLNISVPGDVVKLRSDGGTELVYSVTSVNSIDPDNPTSLRVMSPTDPPSDVITIITCDGAFQDTDDPVLGGEYSRRLVVRAERVA